MSIRDELKEKIELWDSKDWEALKINSWNESVELLVTDILHVMKGHMTFESGNYGGGPMSFWTISRSLEEALDSLEVNDDTE